MRKKETRSPVRHHLPLESALSQIALELYLYGTTWCDSHDLTTIEMDDSIGCGVARYEKIDFLGERRWIILPGPRARDYVPNGYPMKRPAEANCRRAEMACLADIGRQLSGPALIKRLHTGPALDIVVDRSHHGLLSCSTGTIVQVRLRSLPLLSVQRSLTTLQVHPYLRETSSTYHPKFSSDLTSGSRLRLYMPEPHASRLIHSTRAAGLREEHLEIRGFTATSWPPQERDHAD